MEYAARVFAKAREERMEETDKAVKEKIANSPVKQQ